MTENFYSQLDRFPMLLSDHVQLCATALGIGILISLPLGILAAKNQRWQGTTLTVVGFIQTIPSLAMLALMVPILLMIDDVLRALMGIQGPSPFGFLPALIALVLYSMLPIVRNTVTGISGVSPKVVEAAKGMGFTPRQILLQIELPLAMPVMIAGIRTAVVWIISMATLSTQVGWPGLGDFIFSGLQTRNWVAVLFGCIGVAALALIVDSMIGIIEKGVSQRKRFKTVLASAGILVLIAVCISLQYVRPEVSSVLDRSVVTIGSKPFNEQFILSDLLKILLEDAGFSVKQKSSLGTTIAFDALANNDIDLYVEYTGTIWANMMQRTDTPPDDVVNKEVSDWLFNEYGVLDFGKLGFENAYTFAMVRDRAHQMGIRSLIDLSRYSRNLSIGSDFEFFGRPEWRDVVRTYNLHFEREVSFAPTFLYQAIENGDVDVITAYTSDGRIKTYGLEMLKDPQNSLVPYDAILLLSPDTANNDAIKQAVLPIIGAVSLSLMQQANLMLEQDKVSPENAAKWLFKQMRDNEQAK